MGEIASWSRGSLLDRDHVELFLHDLEMVYLTVHHDITRWITHITAASQF